MIISHVQTKQIVEIVVDDIICNKCGNSCQTCSGAEGLIEAHICGGFGAKLGDCVEYKFSLCEDCLIRLFDTFKHSAEFNKPLEFHDEQ
jgi:hypothetical protein